MKVKALVAVKNKVFKPCRKLLKLFNCKFTIRRPVFIKSLIRPRCCHTNKPRKSPRRNRISALLSGFRLLARRPTKMDRPSGELRSVYDSPVREMIFPSSITPIYVKAYGGSSNREQVGGDDEVEDACRSFENYLVEMIVEEGKVGDLTDVEELLYCWKNLKCPVFIDLVCRFYGELCKDLFAPEDDVGEDEMVDQSPKLF